MAPRQQGRRADDVGSVPAAIPFAALIGHLLARRSPFTFDEAVQGADRLTEAVTLFALLELYKAGEANWEQEVPFGPITVVPS